MHPHDLQNGAPALHSVIAIELGGIDDTAMTAPAFDPQVALMVNHVADRGQFDICAHATLKKL
ncbi:hypothetical protein [Sphingomonas glacialis]|uniref:hypothetical protein n=1 Tax=Sphingomonas glacialis TaxID=658225 RepID=UPI001671C074|nr:hypothetical protein [Sphingomonas glacialis]